MKAPHIKMGCAKDEPTPPRWFADHEWIHTHDFEIRAWFADSDKTLIAFGGMLERAVFRLDMPNLSGYLEL